MEKRSRGNWLANAALYIAVLLLAFMPDVSAASMGMQTAIVLLIGCGFAGYFARLIDW